MITSRWGYFLRRIVLSIPIVLFGTTITFLIVRMGPLDPAAAIVGPTGNPAAYRSVRHKLGLDEPLWNQYAHFMIDLLTFHLGNSWVVSPGTKAIDLVLIYAPRTVWLGFWSVALAVLIGIPLGFYAGLHPNTYGDYLGSFGGIVWRAMPNFWLAIMLVSFLSQSKDVIGISWQGLLVKTNVVTAPDLAFLTDPAMLVQQPAVAVPMLVAAIKQIAPAAIVLGSASMGNEMRIGRTAVLETIHSKYVETARAKGVTRRRLVWKHVFRNAMIPLVPVITNEAFLLVGGSVLVETVFAIHGLGFLFLKAAVQGDLPLAGTLMYLSIVMLVGIHILQDFLYTLIDPRVGYETG